MDLFDFFFPEQAQADHLRSISRTLGQKRSLGERLASGQHKRLAENEEDMGFLALILFSLLHKLIDKGVITREELFDHLKDVDGMDGIEDGKLDIGVLRGAMGLPRSVAEDAQQPDSTHKAWKRRQSRKPRRRPGDGL